MNDRDTIIIVDEEYSICNTDKKVKGYSVIVDGPLKMVLDKMLCNNPQFGSHGELISEAVYLGLIELMNLEVNRGSKCENQIEQEEMPEEIFEGKTVGNFDKTEYEEIPFDEFESLTVDAKEENIEY